MSAGPETTEPHHADGAHIDPHQAAEAAASGGLPQFDPSHWASQITWLFIIFGLLYFILSQLVLPKLGSKISERADRIADDLDRASSLQAEAQEAEKAYDNALADARAKANNIAETTRQSVDAEVASEIAAADAEAEAAAAKAEARIQKIRKDALANIDGIASETASEIYAKLLGKAPSAAKLKAALKG